MPIPFFDQKRQILEKRLALLFEQHKAAYDDLNQELSAADAVKIKRQYAIRFGLLRRWLRQRKLGLE